MKTDDFGINIRLIAHEFLAMRQIIPKSNENVYVFDRQELSCLKRMGLVGEEGTHGVKLEFGGGEVEIESKNNNLGQVVERLSCRGSSTPELVVGFGVHYMIDVLSNVVSDLQKSHLP